MPFRVSYLWQVQQDRAAGWSENFWHNSGSLSEAEAAGRKLYPLLKDVHGLQSICTRMRVSRVGPPRLSRLSRFKDKAKPVASEGNTDFATTALLLEMDGQNEGQTRQWIKGIPDEQTDKGGVMDLKGPFIAAMQKLFDELTAPASAWCLRIDAQVGAWQAIQAISETFVLSVPDHEIEGELDVQITKVKTPKGVNGYHRVRATTPQLLQLLNTYNLVPGKYTGDGYIRAHAYDYPKIIKADFVFSTKRNVGRPTATLTGRRTA